MLLKMLPEQVSEYWDYIKPTILECVGADTSEHAMAEMLGLFLSGDMLCWVVVDDNDPSIINAIITTYGVDDIAGNRIITIYSMYSFGGMSIRKWRDAYTKIGMWAKRQGYTELVAVVNNSVPVKILSGYSHTTIKQQISVDLTRAEVLEDGGDE